jgi:serine/threonine protein kinase
MFAFFNELTPCSASGPSLLISLAVQDSNTSALYKKILAANYQPPAFISDSVKDLISGLLTVDPAKRCLPKLECVNLCKAKESPLPLHPNSSASLRSPEVSP